MTARKRTLTEEEIAIALEMRAQGKGITPISRHLKCGRQRVYNALEDRGLSFGRQDGRQHGRQHPRDPVTNDPIGTVPKGHPLYEADQEMLRARQKRHRAEGGWLRSSMGWD